jgi:acetoin utilization deacetylase AcuC-like enzyme
MVGITTDRHLLHHSPQSNSGFQRDPFSSYLQYQASSAEWHNTPLVRRPDTTNRCILRLHQADYIKHWILQQGSNQLIRDLDPRLGQPCGDLSAEALGALGSR